MGLLGKRSNNYSTIQNLESRLVTGSITQTNLIFPEAEEGDLTSSRILYPS